MPIENDSIQHRYIYVLKLENHNYYVGQTGNDTKKRIKNHFKGRGSAWTKKHPPQKIKEIIDLGMVTFNKAEEIENLYTIQYMKKYGWEKVRGGFFCITDQEAHLTILKNHKRMSKVKGIDFI